MNLHKSTEVKEGVCVFLWCVCVWVFDSVRIPDCVVGMRRVGLSVTFNGVDEQTSVIS